jgi:hypothetical protein
MAKLDIRKFYYTGSADVNFIYLFNDAVSSAGSRRIASNVTMINGENVEGSSRDEYHVTRDKENHDRDSNPVYPV